MFKIAVAADIHYFSPKLTDGEKAYRLRSSASQVCLLESGAIMDAAFKKAAESDCDAVLIAGDISNDGEKLCHEEAREKMRLLAEKKPVYAVYSTHDWCSDGRARRFIGNETFYDAETVDPPFLREFYREFGLNQAYDTYTNVLGASSYAVKLSENVRLLALNDDRNGTNKAGYSDEHFEWILKQVKDAKANGETVIVMEHHLVLPNISRLINGGQIIGEAGERVEAMADAGVDFIIVGHSHMQRTTKYTSANGNVLHQINVGALSGHPAALTVITIDDDEFRIDVEPIETFVFDDKEQTRDYITEHTKDVLMGLLKAAAYNKTEFIERFNSIDEKLNYTGKHYWLIKAAAKYLLNVTVGRAARLINFFTFGKAINRKAAKQLKNDNLLSHIMDIYLGVFDGSAKKYGSGSPVYIIVKDITALPFKLSKFIKPLRSEKMQKLFNQISDIGEELTNPSLPDNQHCVIKKLKGVRN